MYNKILIIFCGLILSSCSLIHLFSVKERTSEKMDESNKILSKLKIDTLFSYQLYKNCIDSLSVEKYAINTYKLKTKDGASPLQLRMYNNKGKFINGWEMCFGDIHKIGILDSIPFKRVKHLPINYNLSLSSDLSIVNIPNRELLQKEIEKSDFIILLYWAKWAGWFNGDVIRETQKYLKKNRKQYSILLIAVNTAP